MSEHLINVFKDTMQLCRTNEMLVKSIQNSQKHQEFYEFDDYPFIDKDLRRNTIVEVNHLSTLQAAYKWKEKNHNNRICILNFASAINPGGGVVYGASSQEESICRATTLYPCLTVPYLQAVYYDFNKEHYDNRYTDALIYTPDVKVIKVDDAYIDSTQWFSVDVITCAAPNNYDHSISDEALFNLQLQRARHILHIAACKKIDVLVLGAFGCGVFQNEPHIVSKAWKYALSEYGGFFKNIDFAIYENTPYKNYNQFKNLEGLDIQKVEAVGNQFEKKYVQQPVNISFPAISIQKDLYNKEPCDCIISMTDYSLTVSERFSSYTRKKTIEELKKLSIDNKPIAYATYGYDCPVARIIHFLKFDNKDKTSVGIEDAFDLANALHFRRIGFICDELDPTFVFTVLQKVIYDHMGYFKTITLITNQISVFTEQVKKRLEKSKYVNIQKNNLS